MFPGPGADIYRNEAGEVLGWDYPSYEPDEEDFENAERRWAAERCDVCALHPDDCVRCIDCDGCATDNEFMSERCIACEDRHVWEELRVWNIRRFSKRGEHDF